MLVVLAGLPATGKSTIARRVADRLDAQWLRIDEIEQALRSARGLGEEIGEAGYAAAYRMAEASLAQRTVIADCVNPLAVTRAAWRSVAARASSPILEVELVCSDAAEHRRRVEGRTSDVAGLVLPSWRAVGAREYAPWTEPHLVIDTARTTPDDAAAVIVDAVNRLARSRA